MNLHDLLGRYGADAAAGSRNRLESAEVREVLETRVRRGRRRRAVVGGVGAVAGVSLVAVGVWAVAPGLGSSVDVATSGDPAAAGPYRYVVDDVLDDHAVNDVPLRQPEVYLRGDDEVMCGDELSLTPGVTIHDQAALGRGIFLEAELVTLGDVTRSDPPATPKPLDPDNPDGLSNSWDPSEPIWDGWAGGVMSRQISTALLMDAATVVGVLEGSMVQTSMEQEVEGSAGSRVPTVGHCDLTEISWEDLSELERGDPMDTLLVSQFWGENQEGDVVLLATIVVDPHQPANHSTSPRDNQPDWQDPIERSPFAPEPVVQAELLPPDGDSYQAFVVPGPEASCAPFADQLAAGQPGAHNIQYEIELPGMTEELTGELWMDEPVLSVPTGESPWYKGLQAWIVADEVGGIEDPPLQWHDDDLSADFTGSYPMRDGACAFTAPDPLPQGSVFLIFHGVDMAAVEASGLMVEWVEPSDLYTWIYLGEAEQIKY